MNTAILLAGFWMCTAITHAGKIYQASAPTDTAAKVAALDECKKGGEAICLLVKCELTSTTADGE